MPRLDAWLFSHDGAGTASAASYSTRSCTKPPSTEPCARCCTRRSTRSASMRRRVSPPSATSSKRREFRTAKWNERCSGTEGLTRAERFKGGSHPHATFWASFYVFGNPLTDCARVRHTEDG